MSTKRDIRSLLLATTELTEGVAQAATPATDSITTENLQIKFNEGNQATKENTGTLDGSSDIPIGGAAVITFDVWLKASGTAGTAPEIGKLLKACGYGELITAAPIGAPTAATAGTSNTVTVPGATFVGGVDAYKGMVAQLTGNPVGPVFSAITAFSNAQVMTLAETFAPILSNATLVKIPANVLYSRISTAIGSLTLNVYKDDLHHLVVGSRGNVDYAFEAGKGIKLSFTFQGICQMPRDDSANPNVVSPDAAQAKLVWRNDANNGSFTFAGSRIGVMGLNLKSGNTLDNAPNPNQPSGFDVADILDRNVSGDFNPRATSIATRDILAIKRAGTLFTLNAIARRGAGNSVSLMIPAAQAINYEYEKQGNALGEKVQFKGTGGNTGDYLCFF